MVISDNKECLDCTSFIGRESNEEGETEEEGGHIRHNNKGMIMGVRASVVEEWGVIYGEAKGVGYSGGLLCQVYTEKFTTPIMS